MRNNSKGKIKMNSNNYSQKLPLIFLILSNLFPVVGIYLWDWDIKLILYTYWVESIIIGLFNIVKIKMCTNPTMPGGSFKVNGKPFQGTLGQLKVFMAGFFAMHYGIFTLVHGIFLTIFLFGNLEPSTTEANSYTITSFNFDFDLFRNLLFTSGIIFLSHLFSFYYNYILNDERSKIPVQKLFFAPYGRVFVMHFAVLLGGFALTRIETAKFMLAILIVMKIIIDSILHLSSHNKIKKLG